MPNRINTKKGISVLLLKSILSIYFVVLTFVTLFHLSYEYFDAEQDILNELKTIDGVFTESLTTALWSADKKQLEAIAQGIIKLSVVTGIKIENKDSNIHINQYQKTASEFLHEYDLNYRFGENTIYLATVTLYSDRSVIIDRIEVSFMLILLSAVIKSVFLTLLFFFAVRKFLHKPLLNLIGQIKQIDTAKINETDIQSPENTSKEINDLATAFNGIKDSLSTRIKEIEDARDYFENIFQTSKVGIFQAELNGSLITTNKYIVNLLSYESSQELISDQQGLLELINLPEDEYSNLINQVLNDMPACIETKVINNLGDPVLCEISMNVVHSKHSDMKIIEGMLVDLSERKAKESALREKYVADRANQSKSDFLANMSHEIRTPMNAILGFNSLMLEDTLSPRHREYSQYIDSSARSLLTLINDILDLSKLDAGMLDVEKIPFNLNDLLDKTFNNFLVDVNEKRLELLLSVASDVPTDLIGDPHRLKQVFNNLICNALKFTSSGEVEISITLSSQVNENVELAFCVRDTGIGINKEFLPNIFNSFTQEDLSTTRKYGGSGLGLKITRELLMLMDGKIRLESEQNIGTRCIFNIPFALPTDHASETYNSNTITKTNSAPDVIIVNGNQTANDILVNHFEDHEFNVTTYASLEPLLLDIKEDTLTSEPNQVLIDENGVATLEQLKKTIHKLEQRQHSKLTITVSYFNSSSVHDLFIENTSVTLIDKPISKRWLNALVNAAQSGSNDNASQPSTTELASKQTYLDDSKPSRILVVDDIETNQLLVTSILNNLGIKNDVANNGEEALEKIHAGDYELVFMDIQMPIMGGFEATERIRAQEKYKNLPIVAITATAMAGFRDKCIDLGMNDYLSKPFDLYQLREVLKTWLPTEDLQNTPIIEGDQDIADALASLNLQGIDIEEAMTIWKHDPAVYINLLVKFSKELESSEHEFSCLIENNELNELKEKAHSIMGTANFMFLKDVASHAEAIEDAVNTQSVPDEKLVNDYGSCIGITTKSINTLAQKLASFE